MTTRQTVRGTERMRPMGPQMRVQKAAAMSTASDERAGVFAVDAGLDVAGGDFEYDEDTKDFGGVSPSGKDGESEHGGCERGDRCSEVGDESAEGGKRGEQNCIREADEVERDADESTIGDIDGDLEEEVAGDAAAGVVHGIGHEGEVAVAGKADEAVAEVFALEQDEEGEDDGEQGGGQGLD